MVVLVSLSQGLPASADGPSSDRIVAQGGSLGDGWVALKIGTDGSNVKFDLKAHMIETPNFLQIYKYDDENRFLGGFGLGQIRREGGVYVDINPPGGPPITYNDTFARGLEVLEWSPEVWTLDGVTKLVVWSGGPQASWSWTLRGGQDVRLLGIESGADTHVFMSHDMSGLADVRAHDPVFGTYGARASVDRSKPLVVENTLLGFYLDMAESPPVSNNLLSVDTPLGQQLCYPGCNFLQYRSGGSEPRWPEGSYTFRINAGMGAVWSGIDDVLAVAVDARLPELSTPVLVFSEDTATSGEPGASIPVAVTLTDAAGSAVSDAEVTFELHDGDSVTAATAATAPDGVVRTVMALPERPGFWLLTATANAAGLAVAPATLVVQTTG